MVIAERTNSDYRVMKLDDEIKTLHACNIYFGAYVLSSNMVDVLVFLVLRCGIRQVYGWRGLLAKCDVDRRPASLGWRWSAHRRIEKYLG